MQKNFHARTGPVSILRFISPSKYCHFCAREITHQEMSASIAFSFGSSFYFHSSSVRGIFHVFYRRMLCVFRVDCDLVFGPMATILLFYQEQGSDITTRRRNSSKACSCNHALLGDNFFRPKWCMISTNCLKFTNCKEFAHKPQAKKSLMLRSLHCC